MDELAGKEIHEVKAIVPELLVWLQDGNWPVAGPITDFLSKHTNEIEPHIVDVLRGSDDVWKYWVMLLLILHSESRPSVTIIDEVSRISNLPTASEKTEGLDEIAQEILEKYA